MNSIYKNKTQTIANLSSNKSTISTKWIYKVKLNTNGSLQKYKAQLIVRSFEQKKGIDYEETFVLIIRWSTIRAIISIAEQNYWTLYHMDVKIEFLHEDLKVKVYITQPQGFEIL